MRASKLGAAETRAFMPNRPHPALRATFSREAGEGAMRALHTQGRAAAALVSKAPIALALDHRQADVVEAFDQAMFAEGVDFETHRRRRPAL